LNLLLASERFAPSVGGVETVTRLVAEALEKAEHRVTVVTNEDDANSFRMGVGGCNVLRWPSAWRLVQQYRQADVVILQGPTLRLGWPLLLRPKCAVMVHHMAPGNCENQATAWLRDRLALCARHAAVSEALARAVRWPVEAVLPDPYDDTVFREDPTVARDLDVAFVGRLTPEKGAHVLVEALSILKGRGTRLNASIVGDGPELNRLKQLIDARQLRENVKLKGQLSGLALARLLNRHRVLVAPSLCAEGFGLAALEGIACGCVVLGSRLGGLPEAIGCCGMTFAAGGAERLAKTLAEVLRSPEQLDRFRLGAEQHLAKHRPAAVARRYLEFIMARAPGQILAPVRVECGALPRPLPRRRYERGEVADGETG